MNGQIEGAHREQKEFGRTDQVQVYEKGKRKSWSEKTMRRGDQRSGIGDQRPETRDQRPETGGRRQETGDRRQETGDRRLETGYQGLGTED